jgi:hypothetical protein
MYIRLYIARFMQNKLVVHFMQIIFALCAFNANHFCAAHFIRVKLQYIAYFMQIEREWDEHADTQRCDNEAPINLIRINSN